MAEEMLCTGAVQDLAALISAFNFLQDAYILIEKLPQQALKETEKYDLLRFTRLHTLDHSNIDIASYTSGRIFDEDFELRWDQVNGETKVVFLGTKEVYQRVQHHISECKLDEDTLKELAPQKPRNYYLFGQLLDLDDRRDMNLEIIKGEEYYAEVRVPRLLLYPHIDRSHHSKDQRVQLVVREYANRSTGQVELFRFQRLIPAE